MKEHIFIYGLFRDQARNLLGDFKSLGRASVDGKIYKVNEFYPGFKPGKGKVWGEVILIDTSVLPDLDQYEGEEYKRAKIKTSTDLVCWIYEYKWEITEFKEISCGDWMLR
jgi:gamma-glutamylcyclotransferase (GGCT)/AIG2-like uncharacterized protein YtfP